MSKRILLAVMSDPHGGYTLGLCNPKTTLQDDDRKEVPIVINESQEYLWNDIYIPAVKQTQKLAKNDDIYLFNLGDVTHGLTYPSELQSTRMANQIKIGTDIFLPWCEIKNTKVIRMAKGTMAHVFGEGSAEILVQRMLECKYPKTNVRTVYHGLANIGGGLVDYAHHGPTGNGNAARNYLQRFMLDDILSGNKPADIYLRGHYHVYKEDTIKINGYRSWIYVVPSMCLASEFARKSTRSQFLITNGIIVFEFVNGKVEEVHEMTKTLDIRTVEVL